MGSAEVTTRRKNMIADPYAEVSLQLQSHGAVEKVVGCNPLACQVAHDIRSPLTALNLLLRTEGPLNEFQKNLVLRSLDRLQAITNDLLEQYRSEDFMSQEKNIRDLIQEIIQETLLRYPCKILIQEDVTENLNPKINPNKATLFQRTLSNLINNAVEACEDPVHCVVVLKLSIYKTHFKIDICDNGKGIPEQILPKLGQRGFSYGKANGTGLGLAHAKEFIEASGGALQVRPNGTRGTCVSFFLPF
jgi:signal transduction histidine kinase